jgi:hypothetical protein
VGARRAAKNTRPLTLQRRVQEAVKIIGEGSAQRSDVKAIVDTPRYLIRDRDRVYGNVITRRLRAMGIGTGASKFGIARRRNVMPIMAGKR